MGKKCAVLHNNIKIISIFIFLPRLIIVKMIVTKIKDSVIFGVLVLMWKT